MRTMYRESADISGYQYPTGGAVSNYYTYRDVTISDAPYTTESVTGLLVTMRNIERYAERCRQMWPHVRDTAYTFTAGKYRLRCYARLTTGTTGIIQLGYCQPTGGQYSDVQKVEVGISGLNTWHEITYDFEFSEDSLYRAFYAVKADPETGNYAVETCGFQLVRPDEADTEWNTVSESGDFSMYSYLKIGNQDGSNMQEYREITAPVVTSSLLTDNALTVGNCVASTLQVTVRTTDELPKSGKVILMGSISDDENYTSAPQEFGTFWINRRSRNDDLVTIECYDSMMKGNQHYDDDSTALIWPKTIAAVVSRIAVQMGVEVDQRTLDLFGTLSGELADPIIMKPNDDETLLDVLKQIGELLAGNWTITADNRLRLVSIVATTSEYVVTENDERITAENGDPIAYRLAGNVDLVDIPVVTGSLDKGNAYIISRVTMKVDDEISYTSGDDTGYELLITENPYSSQSICDYICGIVAGITYAPYEAKGATYNPAAELGDWAVFSNLLFSILYKETRKYDVRFVCDISAPSKTEIEDEYPYVTQTERTKTYTVSAVTSKYGDVAGTSHNILLDSNAPYLTKQDASDDRSVGYHNSYFSDCTWTNVSGAPDPIYYGMKAIFKTRMTQYAQSAYWASVVWYASDAIKLEPGEKYTFSCYAKTNAEAAYVTVRIGAVNNNVFYVVTATDQKIWDGDWRPISWTIEAPTDANYYVDQDPENGLRVYFSVRYSGVHEIGDSVEMCAFMANVGDTAEPWNDGVSRLSTPTLAQTRTVQSQIEQTADMIRLKADRLVWEARNSSLDEDGNLSIGNAYITKNWSGVTTNTDVTQAGLVLGRGQIVALRGGTTAFNILMPEGRDGEALEIGNVGYVDADGEYADAGEVDPIVPEYDNFTIGDCFSEFWGTSYSEYIQDKTAVVAATGNTFLSVGYSDSGTSSMIHFNNSNGILIDCDTLYAAENGNGQTRVVYRSYTGNLSSMQTPYVVNGILVDLEEQP